MSALVSICIPTYNRETYVLMAVDSCLKQTYKNLEIIVYDDDSTDNTVSELKKINDPRLKIFVQDHNQGMVPNWNAAILKAKGKYVKLLASDDFIEPKCIELELNAMEADPKAVLVTCRRKFIDSAGNTIKDMGFATKNIKQSGETYIRQSLISLRENRIGEPTATLFLRQIAVSSGLFDPQFGQLADFEFWLRLLQHGNLIYLNKTLCGFRIHDEAGTAKAIKNGTFIRETYDLIHKFYDNTKHTKRFKLSKRDHRQILIIKTRDFLSGIRKLILKKEYYSAAQHLKQLLSYSSPYILLQSIIRN